MIVDLVSVLCVCERVGFWYVYLSVVSYVVVFFFFKQKTAYEMRISDWSSDVCSSDLLQRLQPALALDLSGQQVGDVESIHCPLAIGGDMGAVDRHFRLEQGVGQAEEQRRAVPRIHLDHGEAVGDRKSVVSGKSVSVRVDLGCRRFIKKKKIKEKKK